MVNKVYGGGVTSRRWQNLKGVDEAPFYHQELETISHLLLFRATTRHAWFAAPISNRISHDEGLSFVNWVTGWLDINDGAVLDIDSPNICSSPAFVETTCFKWAMELAHELCFKHAAIEIDCPLLYKISEHPSWTTSLTHLRWFNLKFFFS